MYQVIGVFDAKVFGRGTRSGQDVRVKVPVISPMMLGVV